MAPSKFSLFSSLPPELRFDIWKQSLPEPRWINKLHASRAPVAIFSAISNNPCGYIDWKTDIIDADFFGGFENVFAPEDISRIRNLAIRRFDPEDNNPGTIWQRNPTYRGWPLCAFRFNCNTAPWGSSDLRGCVLDEKKLKSLTSCYLIVPARNQMIFLGGKILDYGDAVSTMRVDLQASKKFSKDSSLCSCESKVHPKVNLVQEISGHDGKRLVDLMWKSTRSRFPNPRRPWSHIHKRAFHEVVTVSYIKRNDAINVRITNNRINLLVVTYIKLF
ncbi:hypothetical protein BJ875DRAFT_446533 [Amylocarpus encephaloides]|uniref:2EXR domain-containing protein n=1 Tax=Amylocarpus encephaloides TaxID=45428 RepID=A0A9P7Y9A3_9HELO|nr:hypothetical protein BJ875DRAFT_446533 [Amylocarpus encephaloides]